MNSKKVSKKKNKTTAENYHLSVEEKLKVLEVRKESLRKNPKASLVDIIRAFFLETQRFITDKTLVRIIKNGKNIIASKER
jgi:hypothetical protein